MRKTTALTLALLALLSFLFFVSPVGRYVLSTAFPYSEVSPHGSETSGELPFLVPEGFEARVYADNVPGARVMARDPGGTLLVSLTREGKLVALRPGAEGDAEEPIVLLENLRKPHGIALRYTERCELYVAEEHRVRKYDFDPDSRTASNPRELTQLSAGGGHYTRTLMMHPDNRRLLVSIGSSCNVCVENDERRASILAIDLATGEVNEFASGLRNTVFMTTHYVTGDIWGTEMGRDNLGEDLPPDEVNILSENAPSTSLGAREYGWPFCYGKAVRDTTFRSGESRDCSATISSHLDIPAHSAPLGIAFVPEEGWPEEWWYDALVAYHGSWNRSTPTGYKIVRFPLDAEGNLEGDPVDFITGFMDQNGKVIGRPVDILLEPGGVMFVSDDKAGKIYRVSRIPQP